MITYADQLGIEAATVYAVMLAYPDNWLPVPVISGVDCESAVGALYAYGLVERKKVDGESGKFHYLPLKAMEDSPVIVAGEMPSVFARTKKIIDDLSLKQVAKIFASTPMVTKRWEKIEHIDDAALEQLLRAMENYVIAKKGKGYKDITLVLNNWDKRRQANNPNHGATRLQSKDW